MESSCTNGKLCEVCSKLDIQRLTNPLHPCRDPLPCSTPPIKHRYGSYLALGSVDEIKSRRSTCDICRLVAERLDKEPSDLDGRCRITESAEFCNFELPRNVRARDPSVTHFHLTQASVIFDTSEANRFQGPSLPWELKERDARSNHYILNFQVSQNRILIRLMLNSQIKAKARAGVEGRDAAAASSLQTEQEFFDTIGGRYVATQANTQLIRTWLHQCESMHGKDCMPSLRLPAEGDREPTLVVDVIQSCLVDTPSRCRYVALSYVWGTAPVFTHLQNNTQDLRKASSLRSLPIPVTIRDAITLVHAIGERYLWVDSLCIIQDDWKMKGTEIMRMGSIYSRALFTIIAAAGDHANSGLPGVEQGTREQVQKILKLANCELLTVIDVRNTPSGLDGTRWAQRAWTFQERMLSNRVLVFSEDQVYWSCRAASHSEERALEEVRDIDRHHLSFPQKYAADCLSWEPLQPSEYRELYDDLLFTYRQRRMTYETDMLNAFHGISEILAGLQNDTFFWGLPESLFSYAMTWSFTGHSARNHVSVPFESNGRKEMISIPSWSWAAWSGQNPDRFFLHAGYSSHVRPMIDFHLVDRKHQLVRIKERSWPDHPGDRDRGIWKNEPPDQIQSPTQHSPFRTGQLCFWTSLANVRAIRRWRVQGPGALEYTLFPSPSPDFQPDPNSNYHSEIVQQDFIVVASGGLKTLILLAIEWKDGVAYREGRTVVNEADWVGVENRQWRLITLG